MSDFSGPSRYSHAINNSLLHVFASGLAPELQRFIPLSDEKDTERRSAQRRAADWRVLFGPAGDLAPGFLADMSPIGVSILSEKQIPVGTEIEIHFGVLENDGRGKLQMNAIVRHCGKGRVGVHFVNVDTTQRAHWWKIMRSDF